MLRPTKHTSQSLLVSLLRGLVLQETEKPAADEACGRLGYERIVLGYERFPQVYERFSRFMSDFPSL